MLASYVFQVRLRVLRRNFAKLIITEWLEKIGGVFF